MTGSVTAWKGREGVWRLRVDGAPWPDGRRRQVTKVFHGTEKQARVELSRLHVAGQTVPGPPRGTVSALLADWRRRADLAPTTAGLADHTIKRYLDPRIGSLTLDELTPARIADLYAELQASGGKDGRPLAPATVRRTATILASALESAVELGELDVNPARRARAPKPAPHRWKAPTPDEVRSMIVAARAMFPAAATFVMLAASTGARRGELIGLRWTDLEGDVLHIRRSLSRGDGSLHVRAPKSGRDRKVYLGPAMLAELDDHRRETLGGEGYIFAKRPDGLEPWGPDYASHLVLAVARTAGVDTSLHCLRHYFASQLVGNRVPVNVVSRLLGHARTSITVDVYSAPLDELDARAALTLEDTLSERTN